MHGQQNIKIHISCSLTPPPDHVVFEILWKNIVEPIRP